MTKENYFNKSFNIKLSYLLPKTHEEMEIQPILCMRNIMYITKHKTLIYKLYMIYRIAVID